MLGLLNVLPGVYIHPWFSASFFPFSLVAFEFVKSDRQNVLLITSVINMMNITYMRQSSTIHPNASDNEERSPL